jgi:glycosyltransferase involved in cell wall biosynthesis
MRIVVNTRLLLKNKLEGIGWFTYETLKRMVYQHPEHEFFFLFDRPYDKSFVFSSNVSPVVLFPQARHPALYYLFFEFAVPRALKKIKADLFLSPDGYLSLSTSVPSVQVIHDLHFVHFPQNIPWMERNYYSYFFPRYANKAARIACVSEYTKKDIINSFQIKAEKIDVVYNGANELYAPLGSEEIIKTQKIYTKSSPYFLFVGALHPRKNLVNLFLAFDAFKKTYHNNFQLLIVGAKMWKTSAIENAYKNMEFKEDVIFTGHLDSNKLKYIYASAHALVYVPYFEGFGIPIVEAMYCDVPVITSNVTSMPEVSGDAALLVNPFSVDEIKDAMLKLTKDEEYRKMLIEKGKIRRKNFSWQQSADRLWSCISKV